MSNAARSASETNATQYVLSGPLLTTTQTYTPTAGTAPGNRLTAYPMGAWSEVKLPDTSQVVSTTTTFGEDSDYTTTPSANPQSFAVNGVGTIADTHSLY